MSIKAWSTEYEPSGRVQVAAIGGRGRRHILMAAMRKLEGLRKSNLKRHGLTLRTIGSNPSPDDFHLQSEKKSRLLFESHKCPACSVYRKGDPYRRQGHGCNDCPVFHMTNHPCFHREGFMAGAVKTNNFHPARQALQRWWKEWYPGKKVPEFEPQLSLDSDVRKVST